MTLTNQHWETLAALAEDPTADVNEACLDALRAKHLLGKKNTKPTGYGLQRLARWQEEGDKPAPAKRKPATLSTRGYGTRSAGGEWVIVDRFGQVLHHATYATDREAQAEADRMNTELAQRTAVMA